MAKPLGVPNTCRQVGIDKDGDTPSSKSMRVVLGGDRHDYRADTAIFSHR